MYPKPGFQMFSMPSGASKTFGLPQNETRRSRSSAPEGLEDPEISSGAVGEVPGHYQGVNHQPLQKNYSN